MTIGENVNEWKETRFHCAKSLLFVVENMRTLISYGKYLAISE